MTNPERMAAIVEAVEVIYGNADKLFARICEDLERGLVKDARSHLSFLDRLLENERGY